MLILRTENLSNVAHGFFGRTGGVSTGIFQSLNCGPGSGDDPAKVAENRARVMSELGGGDLVTLHQIHQPKAITVTQTWAMGKGPQADAMATNVPGIALGILTADCAPILFADRRGARDRRRACRMERRARRRHRSRHRCDGTARRESRAHRRRHRPLHLPGELRGRPGIPRTVSGCRCRQCAILHPGGRGRSFPVRSGSLCRRAPAAAGIGTASRRFRPAPMRASAIFSASAAPPIRQEADYGRQISAIMLLR